jgi:ubiquinone/menaquinone biosynthesis C-methylase UbiE
MDNNYWVKIWNENNIIQQTNLQSQVGRTYKGVPVSLEIWERTLNHLRTSLSLTTDDHLLDICAGNGLISSDFSQHVEKITSLDVSERLLMEIKKLNIPNIKIVLGDLRDIEFPENSFSKIVFYFALQHFTENETVRIFLKIFRWLKKDGICYIGDIPDIDRKWNFYNTTEREEMYFSMINDDDLHIGSWFKKDFLKKLANYSGFLSTDVFDQEKWMINSKYRFDMVLKK